LNSQRTSIYFYSIFLFIIILFGCLTWINTRITIKNPSADEFFIYWNGTRILLKEGVSPYSDIATAIIQQFANLDFTDTPKYALQVTYPLYAELFYLPFAFISDYTLARALWLTFLEASLMLTILVSLRMVEWKPGFFLLGLVIIYELLGYHTIGPLLSGSSIILVTCLVAMAFSAVKAGMDELAGILFALSTIQPQAIVLLILFVLVWSAISRRWRLFVWLAGSLIILIGSASLFMPDWVLQNARVILHYPHTNLIDTPGAALVASFPGVGSRLGWAFTLILSLVLILEWWASRGKDSRWFLWTAGLTLAVSPWIGIPADPSNIVLLIMPSVLVFARLDEHWGRRIHPMIIMGIVAGLFGFWAFFWGHFEDGLIARQYPALFIPLPLITLIGLYWVKWWAVRPRKLLISDLRAEAGLD
jgi:hypothetical protein